MRHAALAPTLATATLVLAGCGEALDGTVFEEPTVTSVADSVVTVTATDDDCRVEPTTTTPGNVAFVVTNEGTEETSFDVLVYDAGQQLVGSVDDIPVGEGRTLYLREVVPATYITVCRPSATGREINGNLYVERPGSSSFPSLSESPSSS